MSTKQEIIQTMQATQAKGFIAKRFFQVTAPQHVDSIIERLKDDEVFMSFILLPNSKKQPTEALICTDQRLLIWNNEFAEDDEIALGDIKTYTEDEGWFSIKLTLHIERDGLQMSKTFKCEWQIMAAFIASMRQAMFDEALRHSESLATSA